MAAELNPSLSIGNIIGRDVRIDPLTGDYDRARTSINDLSNAVYLSAVVPLGSYWADKTLGSRLHLLRREKDIQRIANLAKTYLEECLQWMLDTKRADRILTYVEWLGDGRLRMLAEIYQAGQLAFTFIHHVEVEA